MVCYRVHILCDILTIIHLRTMLVDHSLLSLRRRLLGKLNEAQLVEMAPPRTQRNVTFDGTAALSVSSSAIKALLALGTPVPGTNNALNAMVDITTQEAASMMVGPETNRVFVSVSLSLLKDSVLKATGSCC